MTMMGHLVHILMEQIVLREHWFMLTITSLQIILKLASHFLTLHNGIILLFVIIKP